MKFIISRQELCELTSRIQNIVAPKTPMPILSNFLIEAMNDHVIITATDLTVGVRCSSAARVIEPGATTIPARRFSNLLKELTSQEIEVSTNERDVTSITANSSTFKLPGLSKVDFPALPDLTGAQTIRLKQSELKEMLYRTAFAVSKEDTRYVFTGVSLQIVQSRAYFVGTDGKRLARSSIQVQIDPDFIADCIIPLKAIDEITKSLTCEDEDVILYIMQDKIATEAGDMIVITKLLTGEYPDVEKVIPRNTHTFVSLHREEMMSLLRQISLFTPDTTHSVRFTFSEGQLFLSVNTMDIGEGRVSMPVDYQGPRFDIAFNPLFFLDILRHSKKETVSLGISDSYNPGIIAEGENKAEATGSLTGELPSPLFVLMPMRLNEEVTV